MRRRSTRFEVGFQLKKKKWCGAGEAGLQAVQRNYTAAFGSSAAGKFMQTGNGDHDARQTNSELFLERPNLRILAPGPESHKEHAKPSKKYVKQMPCRLPIPNNINILYQECPSHHL